MRFISLISLPAITLLLAACVTTEPRSGDTPQAAETPAPNCFSLCRGHLKGLCPGLDPAKCERECLAHWTDATLACMQSAASCNQISPEPPHCRPRLDADLAEPEPAAPPPSADCQRACANYRTCAGFADDATPSDMAAAYDTCLEVCAQWPPSEHQCMARVKVRGPGDCSRVSACGLRAMGQMALPR